MKRTLSLTLALVLMLGLCAAPAYAAYDAGWSISNPQIPTTVEEDVVATYKDSEYRKTKLPASNCFDDPHAAWDSFITTHINNNWFADYDMYYSIPGEVPDYMCYDNWKYNMDFMDMYDLGYNEYYDLCGQVFGRPTEDVNGWDWDESAQDWVTHVYHYSIEKTNKFGHPNAICNQDNPLVWKSSDKYTRAHNQYTGEYSAETKALIQTWWDTLDAYIAQKNGVTPTPAPTVTPTPTPAPSADPKPESHDDATTVTQDGSSVTFYNPEYGYSLTLSPVLSYEDVQYIGTTRVYHLPQDGSAKVTIKNINSEYNLFGYNSYGGMWRNGLSTHYETAPDGRLFEVKQCDPGNEVSWALSSTKLISYQQVMDEDWLLVFDEYLFDGLEKVPDQDDSYWLKHNTYYVYFIIDDGRVSLTNRSIDGVSFDDFVAYEKVPKPVAGFSDVLSTDYFADAVEWAVNHDPQITNGVGGGKFGATNTVTRSQAVTFLWRAANCPEPKSMTSPFSDVTDTGAWYYKAVLWAAEQGITNGKGGGKFGVNDTLAYDQMLTFMCRAAGGDTSGDWSGKALSWAAENGLTYGLDVSAKGACPRADVVYCLWQQMA